MDSGRHWPSQNQRNSEPIQISKIGWKQIQNLSCLWLRYRLYLRVFIDSAMMISSILLHWTPSQACGESQLYITCILIWAHELHSNNGCKKNSFWISNRCYTIWENCNSYMRDREYTCEYILIYHTLDIDLHVLGAWQLFHVIRCLWFGRWRHATI